jgi:hypothetical protein|tara:strand:+ start:1477 stop:1815 length:339 start_codon:yes stop_codon:yes gene_type:complete
MTIQYKNETFSLANTAVTSVFTCPTSGTCIVKAVDIANDHSGDVLVKGSVTPSGGSAVQFFIKTLTTDTSNSAINNVLNLEGGDAINFEASVGGVITGVISYALIDRSQENG